MKKLLGVLFILLLLVGFAREAASQPPPISLDQEEYLDAQDWFQYGLALNGSGKYAEAADAFGHSIAVDPHNPLAWLNLGTALALAGEIDQSVEALRKSIQVDPKLALAYSNLGEVYFRSGRFRDALETFTELLAFWPDDPNTHFKRGLSLLYLDDAGQAQAEYLSLKPLDPELAGKLLEAITLATTQR